MKKRNESRAVNSIKDYLQCLENLGLIPHYDRLNAGSPELKSGKRFKGVRKGTSDLVIFLWSGLVIWTEVKTDARFNTEKQGKEDSQIEFMEKVRIIDNHRYEVVVDTDHVRKMLKRYKVNVP